MQGDVLWTTLVEKWQMSTTAQCGSDNDKKKSLCLKTIARILLKLSIAFNDSNALILSRITAEHAQCCTGVE
jgi:hypothetical protein